MIEAIKKTYKQNERRVCVSAANEAHYITNDSHKTLQFVRAKNNIADVQEGY